MPTNGSHEIELKEVIQTRTASTNKKTVKSAWARFESERCSLDVCVLLARIAALTVWPKEKISHSVIPNAHTSDFDENSLLNTGAKEGKREGGGELWH